MSRISNSSQLQLKLDLVLPHLNAAAAALWDHPRLTELYPSFLLTLHWIVRASVSLMERALERARDLKPDPVASGIAGYLAQHIPEERHHDEWLLEDLGVLGVDRAQALRSVPSAAVASLVGSQYYWILHYHPIALLGYLAIAEGNPPGEDHLEEIVRRTQLPRAAFRTLFKHAELDPTHSLEFRQVLDQLPLTPGNSTLLGLSALHTVHMYAQVFEEVAAAPNAGCEV
jgi:hypothetical protein